MNLTFHIPDIEPSIYRHRGIVEFHIIESAVSRDTFREYLMAISTGLKMQAHPEQPEPIITSATGLSLQKHDGFEGMLFWLESGMHAYYWSHFRLITLDMHSCAYLDKAVVEQVTKSFFTVSDYMYVDLLPEHMKERIAAVI
jgi:hypothetical protein